MPEPPIDPDSVRCDEPPAADPGDRPLSGSLRIHRWRERPVVVGDRCACGERVADAFTVEAINQGCGGIGGDW